MVFLKCDYFDGIKYNPQLCVFCKKFRVCYMYQASFQLYVLVP